MDCSLPPGGVTIKVYSMQNECNYKWVIFRGNNSIHWRFTPSSPYKFQLRAPRQKGTCIIGMSGCMRERYSLRKQRFSYPGVGSRERMSEKNLKALVSCNRFIH